MHAIYESGYILGNESEADFWTMMRERALRLRMRNSPARSSHVSSSGQGCSNRAAPAPDRDHHCHPE
jgi:hypothetical protein